MLSLFSLFANQVSVAQTPGEASYQIGSPSLTPVFVDPVAGNDNNSGSSSRQALKSVSEAWNRIPSEQTLTQGYQIQLLPGTYTDALLPNYWELKYGTAGAPIILQAVQGRGSVRFARDINMAASRYVYFIDLEIAPNLGGDAFHCERCDHILVRNSTIRSNRNEAQECVKINQSQYVYIEDSDISGAGDNAIDFVAVQYGHLLRNRIHNASDWCIYTKGGSANLLLEGNEIYNCGTGGYTAGQGTGTEFLSSPWLHYEAYDIKFVNNVIHDTEGAGLGVNGGYNILMAFNSLYKVGSRSHAIEVVFGFRSCDGDVSQCQAYLNAGGWGSLLRDGEQPVPNRNVFIYNNVLYNPAGFRSQDQHFSIQGPRVPAGNSNIPNPSRTDQNLKIVGNIIWNGPSDLPLGIEDGDAGCQSTNPSCSEEQLRNENRINVVEPSFRDPEQGDFRPVPSSMLSTISSVVVPSFDGGDRPVPPLAPEGLLINQVTKDRGVGERGTNSIPGAYASSDAPIGGSPEGPTGGNPSDGDVSGPLLSRPRINPKKVIRGNSVVVSVRASDDSGIRRVSFVFAGKNIALKRKNRSAQYEKTVRINKPKGSYPTEFRASDRLGNASTQSGGNLRVR